MTAAEATRKATPNRAAGNFDRVAPWPRRWPWPGRLRPSHRPCPPRSARERARRSASFGRRPAGSAGFSISPRLPRSASSSSLSSPHLTSRATRSRRRRRRQGPCPGSCGRSCGCRRSIRRDSCRRSCWRHSRSPRRRGGHNRHIPRQAAHRGRRRCRRPAWRRWRGLRPIAPAPGVTRPRALSAAWPEIFSRPLRRRSAMPWRPADAKVCRESSSSAVARSVVRAPIFVGAFDAPSRCLREVHCRVVSHCAAPLPLPTSTRSARGFVPARRSESCTRPARRLLGRRIPNIITSAQERTP